MAQITIKGTEVTVVKVANTDYICLTDLNYGEFAIISISQTDE